MKDVFFILNKFVEYECYFLGNVVLILVLILVPMTTSAEIPVQLLVMVVFFQI